MQFTLAARQTDPHDVFIIEPDVVLAARADHASSVPARDPMKGPLAALVEIASGVAAGASPPSVETSPTLDMTFRATDVDHIQREPSPGGKLARRIFVALFALCGAIAAAAWQHYGATATQMIASWVPPFALTSSPQPEKAATEQAGATADQTPAQAPATDQVAAPAPDPAQMQSMARDLAAMGHEVELLKANIEQLKAGQQQISRDIAKNTDTGMTGPNPRPRISPPPPRPAAAVAAPARKPKPAYAYSPAAAGAPVYPPAIAAPVSAPMPQPEPPGHTTIQPDGEPVMRPPMPLR